MAMGILTFAILPVVGLMGVGLNVSQDSIKSATSAQILQQVAILVQNGESAPFYFSADAERVKDLSLATFNVTVETSTGKDVEDATKGLALKKLDKIVIKRSKGPAAEYSRSFTVTSLNPATSWK